MKNNIGVMAHAFIPALGSRGRLISVVYRASPLATQTQAQKRKKRERGGVGWGRGERRER